MRKVFTLLSAILISTCMSLNVSAQNCGTATRTAVDCKFGTLDAVGWAMQQFFNDGSTATWNFESGASFVENADGTACLKGTITQLGSSPKRSFTVVVNFTGKSTTTTGAPETNNLCSPGSTASWQYYTLSSGKLTGVVGTALEGGCVTLSQHMMPSQYGIGAANQCAEQNNLGLTGWFEYQIVSQPSNSWLSIQHYSSNPVVGQADFCVRLSGSPTTCGGGGGNPCDTDATPPTFSGCPTDIHLTTTGNCANASWHEPTAIDNCSTATVTQTAGDANGSCFHVGTTIVTYTATDAKGNSAVCSFNVTVTQTNTNPCDNDVTPPVFTSCPTDIHLTAAAGATCANATWAYPSATDNCSTATITVLDGVPSGSCFPIGVKTIKYAATDARGNQSLCTFTITVSTGGGGGSDVCASPAANIVGGAGSIAVTGITTSSATIQVFNSIWTSVYSKQVSTSSVTIPNLPAGSYLVNVTVLHAGGQWPAVCTVQLSVVVTGGGGGNPCDNDVTAPAFSNCPTDIHLTATGSCANASWNAPTATDNCGTPTITQTAGGANGSCFHVGTTTVTYAATDAKGNTATCSFIVTVTQTVVNPCDNDVTAPVFSNCPGNINLTTTGSCANASWTAPTATDNCSTVTVTQTAGGANGSCFNVGTTTVTYTATDAKGNKAYCTFTVTVTKTVVNPCDNDVTPPVFANCPANIVKTPTASGSCWTISWTAPTATDNCTTATVTQTAGPANNSCLAPGSYTVTYTATDAKGNKSTCTFTITVNPYVAPCTQPATPAGYMFLGQYGNNFYYKFIGSDCNYSTAKSRCASTGGHLPYFKEAGEKNFLAGKAGGNIWLGLERNGNGWKCTDGSTATYMNWMAGEPNNSNGNENCVQMFTNGLCNDINEYATNWCVIVLTCGQTPPPVVCNTSWDASKAYKIVSRKTGKCLDVSGASTSNNAVVTQYDYWGGNNQKWSVVPTSGGYCKILALHSGKALCSANSYNGAQLCQSDYSSSMGWWFGFWGLGNNGDKDWKVECHNGGYKMTHKMSGRFCHSGSGSANGTKCQIWDWNASDEETFDLVEVSKSNGVNLQNTKVLSLSASVEPNRTRIEWVNNTGATNDVFLVEKMNTATGNFETIVNVKSETSPDMVSYVAYDVKPSDGDNFYRINAISLDGSNTVSDIQKVNFKGLAGTLSVFPNPADETLNIDLSNYKGSAVSLFVYNHLGQAVITQQIENVTVGIVQVDVSNQQVGNYLVRVAAKGKNDQTKSFILNK